MANEENLKTILIPQNEDTKGEQYATLQVDGNTIRVQIGVPVKVSPEFAHCAERKYGIKAF